MSSLKPLQSVELIGQSTMPGVGQIPGTMASTLYTDQYELSVDGEISCVVARLRLNDRVERDVAKYGERQVRLYPLASVRSMVPLIEERVVPMAKGKPKSDDGPKAA